MSKYIDAEKLIAEIERYKQEAAIARFDNAGENADYFQGKVDLCDDLTHIITSLQQEQPEIKSHIEELLKECAGKDGEYYRSRRETLAHLFAHLGGNPSEYMLQPVKQPEMDLEKELDKLVAEEFASHSRATEYGLEVTYNRAELYQLFKRMALAFGVRKEEL